MRRAKVHPAEALARRKGAKVFMAELEQVTFP